MTLTQKGEFFRCFIPSADDAGVGARESFRVRSLTIALAAVCLLGTAAIGWADFNTSPDVRFAFLYLIPIVVAAWWLGRAFALVCALAATVILVANDLTFRMDGTGTVLLWNEFTRATTFFATALLANNLRRSRDRLASEREQAFHMAIRDPLTGLYNLYFMREQLDLLHSGANRTHRPYSVIALDLDGLKALNDRFGHPAGDDALRLFAEDLRASIRAEDVPVRVGGDEFIVLLANTGVGDATRIAERIVTLVRQRSTTPVSIPGVSAGVASWQPGRGIDQILAVADRLLYLSKSDAGKAVTSEPEALQRLELS